MAPRFSIQRWFTKTRDLVTFLLLTLCIPWPLYVRTASISWCRVGPVPLNLLLLLLCFLHLCKTKHNIPCIWRLYLLIFDRFTRLIKTNSRASSASSSPPSFICQEFRWARQNSCVEKNLSNFALRIKDVNVFLVDDKAKNQLRNDFRRRLTEAHQTKRVVNVVDAQ